MAIDIATPFASFDEYRQPFLGGQGPAPAYVMSLDETARVRLRDRVREHLPIQGERFDFPECSGLGGPSNGRKLREASFLIESPF